MPSNNPLSPFLAAWGDIQQAVGNRASTAEIWGALRSVLAPNGEPLPSGAFQAVNQLRGLAASVRNAAESFGKANDSDLVTSTMVSQNINSRDALQQALAPSYEIRYQATLTIDGVSTVQWFTSHTSMLTGMTKGDLVSLLALGNEALGSEYGGSVDGVDNVSISAV